MSSEPEFSPDYVPVGVVTVTDPGPGGKLEDKLGYLSSLIPRGFGVDYYRGDGFIFFQYEHRPEIRLKTYAEARAFALGLREGHANATLKRDG